MAHQAPWGLTSLSCLTHRLLPIPSITPLQPCLPPPASGSLHLLFLLSGCSFPRCSCGPLHNSLKSGLRHHPIKAFPWLPTLTFHPLQHICTLLLNSASLPLFLPANTPQRVWSQFPKQGSSPRPLLWKLRVLTAGRPRKSCLPIIFHYKP